MPKPMISDLAATPRYAHIALAPTDNAGQCEICGEKAPRTRLGRKVNGRYMLFSLRSSQPPENVETLRALDLADESWHPALPVERGGTVEERISSTIRREFEASASGEESEGALGEEAMDSVGEMCSPSASGSPSTQQSPVNPNGATKSLLKTIPSFKVGPAIYYQSCVVCCDG